MKALALLTLAVSMLAIWCCPPGEMEFRVYGASGEELSDGVMKGVQNGRDIMADLSEYKKRGYISCPCGNKSKIFSLLLHLCPVLDLKSGYPTFKPCNRDFLDNEPCKRFRNCETCRDDVSTCVTCPAGKTGSFCTEDLSRTPTWNWLSQESNVVRIPRKADIGSRGRGRYARSPSKPVCPLPEPMHTSQITCTLYPSSITCTQKCVYGHTFAETNEKTASCTIEEGKWAEDTFQECQPYVDCLLVLKSPGDMRCYVNRMDKKSRCEVSCLAEGNKKEISKRSYDCNPDGSWSPSLPFCVNEDKDEKNLVPRPKNIKPY